MHGSTISAPRSQTALGFGAVALAATLWAAAATLASDLFDAGVDTFELAQARAYIATVGLGVLLWQQKRRSGPDLALNRTRKGWAGAALLGLSIALVNTTYYLAIDHLAVAIAIVIQYTAPAMVVAWIAILSRRAPSREVVVALVATAIGVALVTEVARGEVGRLSSLGIVMALASAVLFATYTLLSEKVGAELGVKRALFRGFAVASIGWFIFQIPRGFPSELFEASNAWAVLFVGLAGTLAPFLLYLWGVQRVRADRAAIAATLEPVVAGVIAWIWLSQTLSALQLGGGALVIAGVAFLQAGPRRDAPALAPEP